MNGKIIEYNKELDNISAVLEKLVTKQNASVFDKLCVKCNDLFNKISANDTTSLSVAEIHSLIDVLKRLLDCCIKLKMYKEYLVTVINSNIISMQQQANEKEVSSDLPTPEVKETKQKDNVVKLNLVNEGLKDAA